MAIVEQLIRQPNPNLTQSPYLVTVQENNQLIAVALSTRPGRLILSRVLNFQAIAIIAQDLHTRQALITSVMGPVDEAQAFAETWQTITHQPYRQGMQHGIYQLEAVKPIPKATGYLRQASGLDYDLLINWCQAFYQEALERVAESDQAKGIIERHLENNTLFLWQDKVPVSSAICMGTTPNGIRISYVCTPPQYRSKGYASSCVAALSQILLAQGQKYCFLFTDLANPTSNHIYQAIGYQQVGDMHEYLFD